MYPLSNNILMHEIDNKKFRNYLQTSENQLKNEVNMNRQKKNLGYLKPIRFLRPFYLNFNEKDQI